MIVCYMFSMAHLLYIVISLGALSCSFFTFYEMACNSLVCLRKNVKQNHI
jgi:hypothetical protein